MNLIVAVDEKWGIGKDNHLLASVPGDMQYFKDTTKGKLVVMGRKTLESMPNQRGLFKRINYVLTGNPSFEAERCRIVHSEAELMEELAKVIGEARPDDSGPVTEDDIFLIGGASLYNRLYKKCDKLYITKYYADLDADAFIVNIDEDEDFELESESDIHEDNGIKYRFCIYRNKKNG